MSEIRKENLRKLVSMAGGQKPLAEAAGMSASVVSQILTGRRSLGEKLARKFELGMGMPAGWLDSTTGVDENRAEYQVHPRIPALTVDEVAKWIGSGMSSPTPNTIQGPMRVKLSPTGFAVAITDNSLMNTAPKGAYLTIDPEVRCVKGKIGLFYSEKFDEAYIGLYNSKAGIETLSFEDGSPSIVLEDARNIGTAVAMLQIETVL